MSDPTWITTLGLSIQGAGMGVLMMTLLNRIILGPIRHLPAYIFTCVAAIIIGGSIYLGATP